MFVLSRVQCPPGFYFNGQLHLSFKKFQTQLDFILLLVLRLFCAFVKFQVIHLSYSFVYLIQVLGHCQQLKVEGPLPMTNFTKAKISFKLHLPSFVAIPGTVLCSKSAYLYNFKSYLKVSKSQFFQTTNEKWKKIFWELSG